MTVVDYVWMRRIRLWRLLLFYQLNQIERKIQCAFVRLALLVFLFSPFFVRFLCVFFVGHQFGLICSSHWVLTRSPTQNRTQNYYFPSLSICSGLQYCVRCLVYILWTIFRDSRSLKMNTRNENNHKKKNKRYANETNWETRSVGNHFKLNYLNLFYWNRCERTRAHCHQFSIVRNVRAYKLLHFMA